MDKITLKALRYAEQLMTLKENNPRALEQKIEELKIEAQNEQIPADLKKLFTNNNNKEILTQIEDGFIRLSLKLSYEQLEYLLKGLLIFCEPIIRENKVFYQFKMMGLYSKECMFNERLCESYYEGLAEMIEEAKIYFDPFYKEVKI